MPPAAGAGASVAGDYHYDQPPLLGTMRTGPDLFNIGVRQPSADWHLGHLFQPRAYVAGSTMPAYRFLFDVKDEAAVAKGERVVVLPPGTVPAGKAVVAKPEALDLVAYLQGLKREYPVLTPAQAEAAARLLPGQAKPADTAPAPSTADDGGTSDAAPETNS